MFQRRGVLSDVEANAELPLSEDAVVVRQLICGMYDAYHPVSWDTVESALELAKKYDVDDIQLSCERFLQAEALSALTLPRHMQLACTYRMESAIERCQRYIAAAGNFDSVER